MTLEATHDWTVVIPVKGTPGSKSRLGGSSELGLAIALDTVEAAARVARVIVVTSPAAAPLFDLRARDEHITRRTAMHGVTAVVEAGTGLADAVMLGIAAAVRNHGDGPVAVLLGDVPGLAPQELEAALEEAGRHPLALVPDADGTGSVLISALRGSLHAPAFGAGSRAAHLVAGYREIDVPADSGLRRDVDLAEHLAALAAEGRLGWRTAELTSATARTLTR